MTKTPLETSQDQCGASETGLAGCMEIRELRSGEDDAWDRFVSTAPAGTFFHLSSWKTIIEKVLRRRCHYLTASTGDRISGVFPITLVRSRLFGDCLVSSPLVVYG